MVLGRPSGMPEKEPDLPVGTSTRLRVWPGQVMSSPADGSVVLRVFTVVGVLDL